MGEDKHINSVKFVLISAVVYAHINQYNLFYDNKVLFIFSYFSTIAMPLFIMISGFLSKKLNWKKYKRTALGLFATYAVFQTIYCFPAIVDAVFGLNINLSVVGGGFSLKNYLLMPLASLWFIWGLIFWRLIVLLICRFKIGFIVSISVSVIIALAYGFIDILLPHSKIIVFLPFFLIGYFCPKEFTEKIKTYNKLYFVAILLLLLVVVHFFGGVNYLFATLGDPSYSMYSDIFSGFTYRLLFYPLALICSMAAFVLIPDIFHRWGRKSMDIYLLHPLFVYPVYYNLIFSLNWKMTHLWEALIEFIVTILIIITCLFMSRIKVIRYILYPILLFKKRPVYENR